MKKKISKEWLAGFLLFVLVAAAVLSIVLNGLIQARNMPPLEPLKPPTTTGTVVPHSGFWAPMGEKGTFLFVGASIDACQMTRNRGGLGSWFSGPAREYTSVHQGIRLANAHIGAPI